MTIPEAVTEIEHEHQLSTFVALLGVACLGGIVKWLRNPHHRKRTILSFMTCFMTAGFVGLMAHFLMTWLNVDMSLQFAISGAAGYSGGVLLDTFIPLLMKYFYKKAGMDYSHEYQHEATAKAGSTNEADSAHHQEMAK